MREDNGADDAAARRRDIAAILAAGLLRHCRTARKSVTSYATESSDSPQNPLGPVSTSRLPMPTGSGGYDPRDPEKGRRA